jgi:hypothetical protein
MTTTQRFVLDEKNGDVIDTLNPAGPKVLLFPGEPQDENYLREQILWRRLGESVGDLILQPAWRLPDETTVKDNKDAYYAIWESIYYALLASPLNTLEPALSMQNRFDGTLKRQKTCVQEVTSLSLFCGDVERTLRDLYGDIDSEALEHSLHSVLSTVLGFTRFVRKDLWQEHKDAMNLDYIWGIGVPKGCDIGSSDISRGFAACDSLRRRAREVSKNPSAFSKYTVEFATIHLGRIIKLEEDAPPSDLDDADAALAERIKSAEADSGSHH